MESSDAHLQLIRLRPEDNVGILPKGVEPGETLLVENEPVSFPEALPLGHKIALRPISAREKIIKYGMPIGSTTRAIQSGEHVHLHNMQSDYINPQTRLSGDGSH